jgi:hypothetical protein
LAETIATFLALLLLAACLLPATASVRGASKQSRCLNNLLQISYANAVYAAQDQANMALPVHPKQFQQCPDQPPGDFCTDPKFIGAYEWGGKSGIGQDDFVTGSPGDPLNSKYGTKAGFGPATRPLNRIIYPGKFEDHLHPQFDPVGAEQDTHLELNVYHCPSDTGYTGVHFPDFKARRLSSLDHFGTSYTANMFMTANAGGGEMMSNSPYLHRMSDIISPATTLAYYENNGRFAWTVAPDYCDFLEGIPGQVRGWHGKDWNFDAAFVDGHADSIYMRGYVSRAVMQDDVYQAGYRCIIIRGEGWQKDTLPADRVPTGLFYGGSGRTSYEHGIE